VGVGDAAGVARIVEEDVDSCGDEVGVWVDLTVVDSAAEVEVGSSGSRCSVVTTDGMVS
jgi:hypothetical protein